MNKTLTITLLFSLLLFQTGCDRLFGPTYPKEKITESIKNICRDEYDITEPIDIKISGNTLGLKLYLPEFFKLKKEQQEKIFQKKITPLFKILRRVCFSTDADIKFVIIYVMDESIGAEYIFYNYITDLRKFSAGWISPEEYTGKRIVKRVQRNTLKWGNILISNLISAIESRNTLNVIIKNFGKNFDPNSFSPKFLNILTDMGKKQLLKWYVMSQQSIQTDENERLFYIKVEEHYIPKTEKEQGLHYPSGTIHELYVLVASHDIDISIKEIYTQDTLPEEYSYLGHPSKWQQEDFFVKDYTFKDFFSNQISQLIMSNFIEANKDIKPEADNPEQQLPQFTIESVFVNGQEEQSYPHNTEDRNVLKLTVNFKGIKNKDKIISTLIKATEKTIPEICNNYKFYDINKIYLQNNDGSTIKIFKPARLIKN